MPQGQPNAARPSLDTEMIAACYLIRLGYSAGTVSETLDQPWEAVARMLSQARMAGVPLPKVVHVNQLTSAPDVAAAKQDLAALDPRISPFPPREHLFPLHAMASRYRIKPVILKQAYVDGDLPGVMLPNHDLLFWNMDVHNYLEQIGLKDETGLSPILHEPGVVLQLAREGFSPQVIGAAMGWGENGAARVSTLLFNLRSRGVETPIFRGESTLTPELVRTCTTRIAPILRTLPREHYPPRPERATIPTAHDHPVPAEVIRELWEVLVSTPRMTWEGASRWLIDRGYQLSRQAFNERRAAQGLVAPREERKRRSALTNADSSPPPEMKAAAIALSIVTIGAILHDSVAHLV